MHLPLHTKKVRTQSLIQRYKTLLAMDAEIAALFKNILSKILLSEHEIRHPMTGAPQTMELADADIKKLLEMNLIERVSPRPPNCRVFTVTETAKQRRRLITHTPSTNEIQRIALATDMKRISTKFPQDILTSQPTQLCDRVRFEYALCIDFKSYFHQFALGKRFELWSFVDGCGSHFQLKTIPTGASFCPALAQLFSTALLRKLKRSFPNIEYDVYIDNVRLLARDSAYLLAAMEALYRICNESGVDINESLEEVYCMSMTSYEFLGICFDHVAKTTSLGSKLRNKVTALQVDKDVTLRGYLQWYGLLNYASAILRLCRADFYFCTKFLRRRSFCLLDEPAKPWFSSLTAMSQWKEAILASDPFVHNSPWGKRCWSRATLFTDASDLGFGATLLGDDGSTAIIAGTWDETDIHKHINIKEARAVEIALATMDLSNFDEIQLRIDNTSALYTIVAGDSKSFALVEVIRRIWKLNDWAKVSNAQYVASRDNLADLPSRLWGKDDSPHGLHVKSTNPLFLSEFQRVFSQFTLR